MSSIFTKQSSRVAIFLPQQPGFCILCMGVGEALEESLFRRMLIKELQQVIGKLQEAFGSRY